jgi:hypothetical protein
VHFAQHYQDVTKGDTPSNGGDMRFQANDGLGYSLSVLPVSFRAESLFISLRVQTARSAGIADGTWNFLGRKTPLVQRLAAAIDNRVGMTFSPAAAGSAG